MNGAQHHHSGVYVDPRMISDHTIDRSLERNISPRDIELILKHGTAEPSVLNRTVVRILPNPFLEKLHPDLTRLVDIGVVVGADGGIITVEHIDHRYLSRIANRS